MGASPNPKGCGFLVKLPCSLQLFHGLLHNYFQHFPCLKVDKNASSPCCPCTSNTKFWAQSLAVVRLLPFPPGRGPKCFTSAGVNWLPSPRAVVRLLPSPPGGGLKRFPSPSGRGLKCFPSAGVRLLTFPPGIGLKRFPSAGS